MSEAVFTPWRIERNHKLHFCVVRSSGKGREVRCAASGRESSFRTWEAARRVRDSLNHDSAVESELRAKYAGLPPVPDARGAIARAVRGA